MRRVVWFVFAPMLLVGGSVFLLLVANLSKALSFGHHDPYELMATVAKMAAVGSGFIAATTFGISRLFRGRKEDSLSAVIFTEVADIGLAIFAGAIFGLGYAHELWLAMNVVIIAVAWWIIFFEAKRPAKKPSRHFWRLTGWLVVPALTFWLIHYAAFS